MSDPEERINQLIAEVDAMRECGRLPMRRIRDAGRLSAIIGELCAIAREGARREVPDLSQVVRKAAERRVRMADWRTARARNARARAERRADLAYERAMDKVAELRARAEAALAEADRRISVAANADLMGLDPHGYFVYILWDETAPLYVGQSTNILSRLGTHLGDGKKRPHIRRVTVTRCVGRQDMDALEKRLIRQHRPPWNRVGYTKITKEGTSNPDFSLTSTAA